jgi:copper chaperone CopZ
MKHISLQVEKMSCGHCIPTVEEALTAMEGVVSAKGNENTDIVAVFYDETITNLSKMHAAVKEAGYLII